MIRKIEWENWNSRLEEIENSKKKLEKDEDKDREHEEDRTFAMLGFDSVSQDNVYTPWGTFHKDNPLKPTDRYQCWIGHTNFTIGKSELLVLNREIDGIAALTFLDRYTFCVGIARSFNFKDVRSQIEGKICNRVKSETDA